MKKSLFLIFCLLIISTILYFILEKQDIKNNFSLLTSSNGNNINTTSTKATTSSTDEQIPLEPLSILAENLDTPWAIALLANEDILFTQRKGTVELIQKNTLQKNIIATIPSVKEIGEGGLLGIALHPDFENNNTLYLYYTYSENNENTLNRVVKMIYENNQLQDEQIILNNIPGARNHNGGALAFGPDKKLYITTGDAGNPSEAQNTNSLAGKILRINDDGSIPDDNPFQNAVYSYGHRNPQGIAWDNKGNLWSTEHGRSGILSGYDELNMIEKGANYGWPEREGDETQENMISPYIHSGARSTWAPAGLAIIDNTAYFTGLRGQTLYSIDLSDKNKTLQEHFSKQYGRLRAITKDKDKNLYMSTSNQDGRGNPKQNDDTIITINTENL